MELWLTLILLYAWQCVAWLPARSAVVRPSRRWLDELEASGPHWLSLRPSALCLVASRLPFRIDGDQLAADDPLGRHSGPPDRVVRRVSLRDPSAFEARRHRVWVDGRAFVDAPSKAIARHWTAVARDLADLAPEHRAAELESRLARALDGARAAARLHAARRHVRWLAPICDLYAIGLFAAIPALGLVVGAERAIFLSAAPMLALHVAGVGLAFRAHRRLHPDWRGDRLEQTWMAALYPPALLRMPQRLVEDSVAGFHPLALARGLWPEATWREALVREVYRLARRARRDDSISEGCARERTILIHCAGFADESEVSAPRPRIDPTAASYCPVCLDDFRPGHDHCSPCGIETIAYPG